MTVVPSIRRASVSDTDTVVRILIASKEASFPDTIEEHDLDVQFWTRRWRDYILRGRLPLAPFGDGWVFLAEVDGEPVAYVAYHHTSRHGTDAELQNIYVLKEWQRKGIGARLLGLGYPGGAALDQEALDGLLLTAAGGLGAAQVFLYAPWHHRL